MINSIILIRPKAEGKIEFPFSLLYVGTALKKAGYQVKIIDLHAKPELEDGLMSKLKQNSNTLLGISALSGSYLWVKNLSSSTNSFCCLR